MPEDPEISVIDNAVAGIPAVSDIGHGNCADINNQKKGGARVRERGIKRGSGADVRNVGMRAAFASEIITNARDKNRNPPGGTNKITTART